MAVETLTATGVLADPPQNGFSRSAKYEGTTVEISAAASVSSRYTLGYVPSGARLSGLSRLYWDDMATSGAPTLDLGLRGTSLTYDEDLINDGLTLATVNAGGTPIIKAIENYGKPLWQIAGLASDPDEVWTLVGVIRDAAVIAGGTLATDLLYSED